MRPASTMWHFLSNAPQNATNATAMKFGILCHFHTYIILHTFCCVCPWSSHHWSAATAKVLQATHHPLLTPGGLAVHHHSMFGESDDMRLWTPSWSGLAPKDGGWSMNASVGLV